MRCISDSRPGGTNGALFTTNFPDPPLDSFPLDAITTAGGQSDIITVVPKEHLNTLSAAHDDYSSCDGPGQNASSGSMQPAITCGTGRVEDVILLSYLSRNVVRCAFRDLGAYSTPKIRRRSGTFALAYGRRSLGGAGEFVVVAAPPMRLNVEAWAAGVAAPLLCVCLLRARRGHRAGSVAGRGS